MPNTEKEIEKKLEDLRSLESTLKNVEAELAANEAFIKFLELQQTVADTSVKVFKEIELAMIDNNIKSIKGTWGSLTIVEKLFWDTDLDKLAPEFKKVVANTSEITTAFKLDNEAPAGATPKYTKYLMKRLK